MARAPRVFLVDDEPALLQALKRVLPKLLPDVELRFYSDPFALLHATEREAPDVVVSDIRMPGLDGLDLAARLNEARVKRGTAHPAIIMLTGTADLNAATDAINRGGVFRFYTKPCDSTVLAEGIRAAILQVQAPSAPPHEERDIVTDIGAAALNMLGLAVLILDRNAKIVFTNNAGGQLLSEKDGLLWSPDGKCRTFYPGQTDTLFTLAQAAANNDSTELGEGVMAVSRKSGRRPFSLSFAHLDVAGEGHALVFASDPEVVRVPSSDTLQTLLELTNAEARLAYQLAQGETLANAAGECGITDSTARTYLKHIFAKTGTSRQAELVWLILTSSSTPPQMGGFSTENPGRIRLSNKTRKDTAS